MKKNDELLQLLDTYLTEEEIITSDILCMLSNRIIKYRLDHNMTQKQFAKYLNVGQSMISKIESENYNFSIAMIVKIFTRLGLKLEVNIIEKETNINEQIKDINETTYHNIPDNDSNTKTSYVFDSNKVNYGSKKK